MCAIVQWQQPALILCCLYLESQRNELLFNEAATLVQLAMHRKTQKNPPTLFPCTLR
eukprot:TRINITY_DN23_c0_g1_i1.p2 TRINITY_DN23_c0_g1~~TRINITY_DN23_c0_g1_i1.p2  ORF type:complete len:57 (+),score=7.80 TRINITY_DN23_c0_g1_i1:44-214(+)